MLFAIHAPQSLSLKSPNGNKDLAGILINFRTNGADTSRCVLEVVIPNEGTHRVTFNLRGQLVDQKFIDKDSQSDEEKPKLSSADYIVDGRDTRADNPYTYEAPVNADAVQRGDVNVGNKQPPVYDAQGRLVTADKEQREKAYKEAEEAADKKYKEERKRAGENAAQRKERLDKEIEERRSQANEELARKAKDILNQANVKQEGELDRKADGSLASTPVERSRDPGHYDPLIPAASSPLPGSPPAHRASSANPTNSVVNTSTTINTPSPVYQP